MSETKNVLLVGVGGQGTILASKILSTGLLGAGYDVKMSEVHGMAQRGGSVSTQVRYGTEVFSPIIGPGEADILVAFEAMEALRWLDFLKPSGVVVINDFRIPSTPILLGKNDYPEGVIDLVSSKVSTKVIDAAAIAAGLGNPRTMNLVLLGALIEAMGLSGIDWTPVVAACVKAGQVEMNMRALESGAAQAKTRAGRP